MNEQDGRKVLLDIPTEKMVLQAVFQAAYILGGELHEERSGWVDYISRFSCISQTPSVCILGCPVFVAWIFSSLLEILSPLLVSLIGNSLHSDLQFFL